MLHYVYYSMLNPLLLQVERYRILVGNLGDSNAFHNFDCTVIRIGTPDWLL